MAEPITHIAPEDADLIGLSLVQKPCGHWSWCFFGPNDYEFTDTECHETILAAYQCAVRWAMHHAPDEICDAVVSKTHDLTTH